MTLPPVPSTVLAFAIFSMMSTAGAHPLAATPFPAAQQQAASPSVGYRAPEQPSSGSLIEGEGGCLRMQTLASPGKGWIRALTKASPDGHRVAFVRQTNSGYVVVIDGHQSPQVDDVRLVGFSPDSRRFLWCAVSGGVERLMVDDAPVAQITGLLQAGFTADSSKWFAITQSNAGFLVRVGDSTFGPFADVTAVRLPSTGPGFAFSARDSNGWHIQSHLFKSDSFFACSEPVLSPNGARVAFSEMDERRVTRFWENATCRGALGEIGSTVFSRDSSRMAWSTKTTDGWFIGLDDGTRFGPYKDLPAEVDVRFSPDGRRIAFVVQERLGPGDDFRKGLVVDGAPPTWFAGVNQPDFSGDGLGVAAPVSLDHAHWGVVVNDQLFGPFDGVGLHSPVMGANAQEFAFMAFEGVDRDRRGASTGSTSYLHINGARMGSGFDHHGVCLEYSKDGTRFLWNAFQGGTSTPVAELSEEDRRLLGVSEGTVVRGGLQLVGINDQVFKRASTGTPLIPWGFHGGDLAFSVVVESDAIVLLTLEVK